MQTGKEIQSGIVVYLALTFALSSIFYALIISAGTAAAKGGIYVFGLMWSPGVAALLTRLLRQRNVRGIGWAWGRTHYQLLSYLLPLAYASAVYLPVWAFGLGEFHAEALQHLAEAHGWQGRSQAEILVFSFILAATVGVLGSCLSALGEEVGWRGFLVPELAKITSFSRTALISGAIWSVWHYPLILFADYRSQAPTWYALLCFTVMVMGISFIFAWLRLKSGSVWTGMVLHASHNLFIQAFYDPLTKDTGVTKYLIGEFGAGLAVVGVFVGFIFWHRRAALSNSSLPPS